MRNPSKASHNADGHDVTGQAVGDISHTARPEDLSGRISRVFWLSLFAGGLLGLIGVRFLVVPDAAALTFGLAEDLKRHELHYVIALRDIWLGGMGIALAVLREWRCLALWFTGAASVCLLDSLIVLYSSANPWAMAFHLGSALFCALVGRGAWKLYRAQLAGAP